MAGQNKATVRTKLRSALAHKRAADTLLTAIVGTQNAWNAIIAKLATDTPGALDTNYAATKSITSLFDADAASKAQHKQTLRKTVRSALANRMAADEICDALEEVQVAINALLVKLDAEAGVLNDTDYVDLLAVAPMVLTDRLTDGQHHSTLFNTVKSGLANEPLANDVLGALRALQLALNSQLALLDTSLLTGSAARAVAVLAIDAPSVA